MLAQEVLQLVIVVYEDDVEFPTAGARASRSYSETGMDGYSETEMVK